MDQERVLSLESRFSAACVGLMEPRATCCSWVKVSARSAVVPLLQWAEFRYTFAGLDVQVVGVLEVVVHRGVEALDGRDQAQLLLVQLEALVGGQEGEELLRGLELVSGDLVVDAEGRIDGARRVRGVTLLRVGIWPKP